MKKNLFLLSIIIFLGFNIGYSQDWIVYSDSIWSNLNKVNDIKAKAFLELAEQDLSKNGFNRDTIYADFLCRKGLVQYFEDENPEASFNESIGIWNDSKKINQAKMLMLHYYYGSYYHFVAKDYNQAYKYYKICYDIGKSNNLESNLNFQNSLYRLCHLDFWENKNYEKAKNWAREYIELKKSTAFAEFNFEFVNAYRYADMSDKRIEILEKYLYLYMERSIESPALLFKIYKELMNINYLDIEDYREAIKNGEKALEIAKSHNLEDETLELVYNILSASYEQIGDNINERKYENLSNLYFPNTESVDYYEELTKLVISEKFNEFKAKFNEYEIILISQNNYDELLEIYAICVALFEKSILYNKEEIKKQIDFLQENEALLNETNKIYLKLFITEFSVFTKDFFTALKISNGNLDVEDISIKLMFYKFKVISEAFLGLPSARETAYKTISIAENSFGKQNPQTLPYLILPLQTNVIGTDNQSVTNVTKALKIIYDNQLEHTEIASQFWQAMANEATLKYNLKDAIKYSQNAIDISEKLGKELNPMIYYSSLIVKGNAYLLQGNYEESWLSYEKAKLFIETQSNILDLAYGDYYSSLGNYYFYLDEYKKSKYNYEKSFEIYGEALSGGRQLNLILCDYFIKNDAEKTTKSLEDFYMDNQGNSDVLKMIYILKFNANNDKEARDILTSNINSIIQRNNDFFHLLSETEREIIYKNFTDQFEYLNTHLLLSDNPSFLTDYINFRFYYKSLLFFNNSNKYSEIEESSAYFNQLKTNNILINKYYEQSNGNDYSKEINELQQKNRELEKLLSQTKEVVETPTINQIKKKLKENNAYVEIIRINKQSRIAKKEKLEILNKFTDSIYYGAVIIKKNEDAKFILINESKDLEENYLKDYNSHTKGNNKFIVDKKSYSIFFKSLENELKGIESVYLVSDGIYNSINVEAFYNPSREKYVLEYLNINRVISARSLLNEPSDIHIKKLTAVLIGNPEFELEKATKPIDNQIVLRDYEADYVRDYVDKEQLSYLPGTEKEIHAIETILKKEQFDVRLFASQEATETNLKTITSPTILHLATHGYFLRTNKEDNLKKSLMGMQSSYIESNVYLKSGLLLAGAQNTLNGKITPIESSNGIFTAAEAKNLNLINTELVVLSACETGLGDILVGEGIYGLQRAFMIAGTKSVIMSLWKVNDDYNSKD